MPRVIVSSLLLNKIYLPEISSQQLEYLLSYALGKIQE